MAEPPAVLATPMTCNIMEVAVSSLSSKSGPADMEWVGTSRLPHLGAPVGEIQAMDIAGTSSLADQPNCTNQSSLFMDCSPDTDPEPVCKVELVDTQSAKVSCPPASFRPPAQDALSNLPAELKELVFQHLNLLDKLDLRLTNYYFFNYIPAYTHSDYLKAEQLKPAVDRGFYTCCMCSRFRPRAHFADNSRMHGKGVSSADLFLPTLSRGPLVILALVVDKDRKC